MLYNNTISSQYSSHTQHYDEIRSKKNWQEVSIWSQLTNLQSVFHSSWPSLERTLAPPQPLWDRVCISSRHVKLHVSADAKTTDSFLYCLSILQESPHGAMMGPGSNDLVDTYFKHIMRYSTIFGNWFDDNFFSPSQSSWLTCAKPLISLW